MMMMMNLSSVFSFAQVEAHARNRGVSQGSKSLASCAHAPFQDSEVTRRRKLREQVARCWDLLQMEEERNRTDCRN